MIESYLLQHIAKANRRKIRNGDLIARLFQLSIEHRFKHFGFGGQEESVSVHLLSFLANQKADIRQLRVQKMSSDRLLDWQTWLVVITTLDQNLISHFETR